MAHYVSNTKQTATKGGGCILFPLAKRTDLNTRQQLDLHWLNIQHYQNHPQLWGWEAFNVQTPALATRHRESIARGVAPNFWQERVNPSLISHWHILNSKQNRSTITSILQWLRSNHNLHPRAFLSDCDKAITKAITDTYANSHHPPVHWGCGVHIIKGARCCTGEYVCTSDTDPLHFQLTPMNRCQQKTLKRCTKPLWPLYIHPLPKNHIPSLSRSGREPSLDTWPTFSHNGARPWTSRQLAFVTHHYKASTNNFIESWHQNLKYHFLIQLVWLRADKFIHTLVVDVVPNFWQTVMATQLGFWGQAHTKFQGIAKGQANSYTNEDLTDLGINVWSVTDTQVHNQLAIY